MWKETDRVKQKREFVEMYLKQRYEMTKLGVVWSEPEDGLQDDRAIRREYNEERPHRALDGGTPASCYSPSSRQMPNRLAAIEYEGHLMVRKVRPNGTISWKGSHLFLGEPLEGEHVGLEETDYGVWSIYFGPTLLGILDEYEGRIFG